MKSLRMLPFLLLGSLGAHAASISGTLYYTTYSGGTNVHSVDYSYNGSALSLTNNIGIAATTGADGLLFAPDGNLVVAGQSNNVLSEITKTGSLVNMVGAGTGSYHLALSSNAPNATLYNLWNGSGSGGTTSISATTLSSGGLASGGIAYTVNCSGSCSTDVRGLVYDPVNNTWYYGTAADGQSGSFGTVSFDNTSHVATLTQLMTNVYAHGLTYDPFTQDIIMSSANTIQQYSAALNSIVSTANGPGNFDQSAVDGQGHLFVASNSGNLQFIDYAASGLIGSSTYSTSPFLAGSLDDIAPLSGTGSNPVPEPGMLSLFGAGLLAMGMRRRKN